MFAFSWLGSRGWLVPAKFMNETGKPRLQRKRVRLRSAVAALVTTRPTPAMTAPRQGHYSWTTGFGLQRSSRQQALRLQAEEARTPNYFQRNFVFPLVKTARPYYRDAAMKRKSRINRQCGLAYKLVQRNNTKGTRNEKI